MNYYIEYPSGKTFEIDGEFELVGLTGKILTPVITGIGVNILDPRAIVRAGGVNGVVVYNPRKNVSKMKSYMKKWMRKNKYWASGLEKEIK